MTAFLILCAVLWLAALAVIWITAELDHDIAAVLSDPLPNVDASDAEFEAWAMRALGITDAAAFETDARAELEAPTRGEIA